MRAATACAFCASSDGKPKFARHDAEQIIFERHDIDDRQASARIDKNFDPPAIRFAVQFYRHGAFIESSRKRGFERGKFRRFARAGNDHFAQVRIDRRIAGGRRLSRAGRFDQAADFGFSALF